MKTRIKIDSAILSFVIILTGVLYQFRFLYPSSELVDDIFDYGGLLVVLLGTFLRMSARGYKKAHSKMSENLVTDGPYALTRNPMYLGSFLMGAGFVLIVWPWWSLPLYGVVFYLRFRRQIIKEEGFLSAHFGDAYQKYMCRTPRFFPTGKTLKAQRLSQAFMPSVLFNTKEKWGLMGWPLMAVLLETMQERLVFGFSDILKTVAIFAGSALAFWMAMLIAYQLDAR